LLGEANQVVVSIKQRGAEVLKGRLHLWSEQGLRRQHLTLERGRAKAGDNTLRFNLPVSEKAVPGDWQELRAVFVSEKGEPFFSATTKS
jgi:hypothetical protein